MATPKKKHLIELMIEAGVKWPDGAEYAAQDKKNLRVNLYRNGKPNMPKGEDEWLFNHCNFMGSGGLVLPSLCRNWHQTIVTREQYAEAVAANVGAPAVMPKASESERDQAVDVVDAVEWHNPPSIEQLTADYHAKAAEADRLQAVADDALKAADDALLALEKAGELLGLVISIDTKSKHVEQPAELMQPIITDWRDLRVGDVIWVGSHNKQGGAEQGEYEIRSIDANDEGQPIGVTYSGMEYWPDFTSRQWRFIRRP